MARGRLREEWEQTTALICTQAALKGQKVDPAKVNPYYVAPKRSPEREARESREAFLALEMGLRAMCGAI